MAGPSRRSAGARGHQPGAGDPPAAYPQPRQLRVACRVRLYVDWVELDPPRREELLRPGAGRSARPVEELDHRSGNSSRFLTSHVRLLAQSRSRLYPRAADPSTPSGGETIVEPRPAEGGEPREHDQDDEGPDESAVGQLLGQERGDVGSEELRVEQEPERVSPDDRQDIEKDVEPARQYRE